MSLRNLAAFFYFGLWLLPAFLWAEELDIQFKTSPPAQRLRPFSDPATLSVRVANSDGRAVEQGWVEIRMTAPQPGGFFSTDFPIVEGTALAEMRLPLRGGRVEWKYLFPIRGDYRITVDAFTVSGATARKSFQIGIRENETKWISLGIFISALFLLGVIAGRIFTSARATSTGKIAACLLVTIFWLGFCRDSSMAQEQDKGRARLEVEPGTVGKMSRIRWSLGSPVGEAKPVAQLTLTITHLEKGKIVFAVEKLLVSGEFSLQFQFTDGDDYRVLALAQLAGGKFIRAEQTASVTAVQPPAKAMVPALAFFLAIVAIGLAVGRRSKRAANPT